MNPDLTEPRDLPRARALPAERPGRAAPPHIVVMREGIAAALHSGLWHTDIVPEHGTLGGVRVLRFRPAGAARGTVLHLHGGGFRVGCPEMDGPFAAVLAARCQVEVVCPAYRLAPEYPFPAGLSDALAAMRALAAENGRRPLIVSGASAGGGLAASLMVLTVGAEQRATGLTLHSAWLDLGVSAPSYAANAATDTLFSRSAAREAADHYLQGFDAGSPLVSPLLAPAAVFPPTFISFGTGEVLADDGRLLHRRLADAGQPAELCAVDDMEHIAVVRQSSAPQVAQTFARLAAFVDRIMTASG